MSSRWTATGWRSNDLYQGQQGRADRTEDPAAGGQPRPTLRRTRAGAVWSASALPDRGKPELTLCLALIHHIVISANIPMGRLLGWLAGLGTALVIEFVGRDDEMVQTLLRNKDDQYPDYNLDRFEAELSKRFVIHAKRPLKGGKRQIYYATPLTGMECEGR